MKMTELKIKYIFLGNKPIKEPQLINNILCIYSNSGNQFSFAKKNARLFEYLLNSNNQKNTIALLHNNQFYDFVSKMSNINNYTKILENNKLSRFNYSKDLIRYFQRGDVFAAENLIKKEIKINYLNLLKEKYPQLITQKKENKKNTSKKETKVKQKPLIRKISIAK
jgi:hypothetical protein